MTILKAKDITGKDLQETIGALSSSEVNWLMIIETVEELRFEFFDKDSIPLESAYRGRIFSRIGELKWRKVNNFYRTVFLGKKEPVDLPFLDDHSDNLSGLKTVENGLLLWGERTDKKHEWIEQEVPHRFNYPFQENNIARGRLKIVTEDWVDQKHSLIFSRFSHLEETTGESHASR